MGWKRTFRTIGAMQRQSQRAERQRYNELVKQQRQVEKMAELDRASWEVELYEARLGVLSSIHKEGSDAWDWKAIQGSEPPPMPSALRAHEEAAKAQFESYKPSIADKLLKRVEKKLDELAKAINDGCQLDQQEYQEATKAYEQELVEWGKTRDLASRILANDHEACKEAINKISPFSELVNELGTSMAFHYENESIMEVNLKVKSEDVIPREVKSLLKSGKLSIKEMPKAKFFELYQDYICGCVLRIAREVFALLPTETVIVTALSNVLNTKTGHLEESPILSAVIPRATFARLNLESLDPSNSMSNFVHRMNFKKIAGFSAVEKILPSDIQTEQSHIND